jgi:hypothetical protein
MAIFTGTNDNDTFHGTLLADTINGMAGDDVREGAGTGNKMRSGGDGSHEVTGYNGADMLEDGSGAERIKFYPPASDSNREENIIDQGSGRLDFTDHRACDRSTERLRHWWLKLFTALVSLGLLFVGHVTAAPPAAPTLSAPANGAQVTIPATLSWSATGDPSDIGGYNWEVSLTSDFASVIERNPTLLIGSATTNAIVSGLPNGAYFWRVQAVSRALESGPWSSPRSLVIAGASPGVPGSAVLDPPQNGPNFHSWETITFTWSAVPGAVDYILQESVDPSFPVDARVRQINIPGPTERISFNPSLQGNFKARVIAVGADGLMGTPSNAVDFSVLDSNPFPSPPTPVAPVNGATLQLPFILSWTHVPNHQELGYEVQISGSSTFSTVETTYRVTENQKIVPRLTAGTKFWRVRSQHGYVGANPAYTAWSAARTVTVLATPLRMAAVSFPSPKFSGGEARGSVDITGPAPAGGATITFTTDRPELLPELPQSRVIAAGESSVGVFVFPTGEINSLRGMRVGFVTTPATATVTATYNGTSASTVITILPPKLNDTPLQLFPLKITGGGTTIGIVDLEVGCFAGFCDGLAPPEGFQVSLSSSSPAATVPPSFTLLSGQGGNGFLIQTQPVTKVTPLTITAHAGDATANLRFTLTPSPPPDSLTLQPVSTDNGSQGVVWIPASAVVGHDQLVSVTSSNPRVAAVPEFATIYASSGFGRFNITTGSVLAPTVVTVSVTGGGVTRTANLTVWPPSSLPTLTALTVSPTSVAGGTNATGTVTLGSAAPSGGVAVSLGSNQPGSASVPASVTVPAGATSATFTVTTFPVGVTTVQLSATLGSVTQFASLGITNAPTLSTLTLSPSTVMGGNTSTGTVTLSAAAPSGGVVVTLNDDSAVASMPTSVTVAAGSTSGTFSVTTSAVTTQTPVIVSAMSGGITRSATLTVNPPAPAAPTLQSPANGATGVAQPLTLDWNDVTGATSYEVQLDDSSTISSPFVANPTVTASQATLTGLPARQLWWRVRASNASGVFGPFSSIRSFTPLAASTTVSLSAISLNPTSVVGPTSSTGTVTLSSAAPSGGAVVALSSNSGAAAVPASVTVVAGATSANFSVTTSAVAATTTATISAVFAGVTRTTTLTVNPPGSTVTLSASATGRSGERITSSPTGINVAVGSTASASFASGTSITLTASNGRDAIWSGACSSGGNKARSCTFTINANASVTGNVQ